MSIDDPIELVVVRGGRTHQVPRSVATQGQDAVEDFIARAIATARAAEVSPPPPAPPTPPAPAEE